LNGLKYGPVEGNIKSKKFMNKYKATAAHCFNFFRCTYRKIMFQIEVEVLLNVVCDLSCIVFEHPLKSGYI